MGAELLYWSPFSDPKLPEGATSLYFGGGFPEMFAAELSANQGAIASIKQHAHLPIYAECGGLMYLSESITTFMQGKLLRNGGVVADSHNYD
jgi:cobyrinic acid a,c-diamide synthase